MHARYHSESIESLLYHKQWLLLKPQRGRINFGTLCIFKPKFLSCRLFFQKIKINYLTPKTQLKVSIHESAGDCPIVKHNNFLKRLCLQDMHTGATVLRCHHSNELYMSLPFMSKRKYDLVCKDDPHFYQSCFDTQVQVLSKDYGVCNDYICQMKRGIKLHFNVSLAILFVDI